MPPVELNDVEARVLGCLMEKAVTTPDSYPLSLNALVTACNQTTNRDPIVRYDDNEVEHALEALREKGLSRRVKATGQRVVKHRHVADEGLEINAGEFAVIGVLLLRGAQTPGELKSRTERWHRFRSLDDVEEVLQRLATRGFTRQLPRRPGQKESRWAQLLTGEPAVEPPAYAAPAATTPAPSTDADATPATVPVAAPAEREAARPHSIDVRDPSTGESIRTVAITEAGEIGQKLERARRAQPAWAARAYEERAAALRAFRDLLEAETDECAAVTSREMGKSVKEATNEIRAVLDRIDWNVDNVGRVIAPRSVAGCPPGMEERITCEPVGVVAHVSAWNYPYFVALNSIVPALLAGNAVLYKPSELATLTGLRLVDLLHRAGVPVDVVHVVVGDGMTGAELVDSDVDMVCFTGSHATGQKVARAVANRLVRLQLELGGKDAAYVCDDVDVVNAAIAVAEGAFYNCGQSCSATERVYVHNAIWDQFVEAFVEAVADTDVGPMARAGQLEVLEEQIEGAVRAGAKIAWGGSRVERPGNWFEPTVLLDVDDRMAIMRDESFGPVIALARVHDDEEAVRRMDDTDYGLGASVFTADRARAERILARLDVGNAYWNTADRSTVRLPWSGRRHSGLGVSMSESGVRTFVREKAWHLHGS
ncbi:MAG TPA: aldehyde dehydrogenase family protein [Acidimicrobiia bacterium]|nr:aldehyde dehydrogenase family protein [Acidimicrobiia bacterium]